MVLIGWLGWLAACVDEAVNWEFSASVPDTFFPAATQITSDGALLGGYIQGGEVGALLDQRAAVYRWNGRDATAVYDGPGWLVSLAVEGSVAWAVAATLKPTGVDSDYRALRSIDGGVSWEERGSVPGTSILRVLAVSDREAWGGRVLIAGRGVAGTADGGAHWLESGVDGAEVFAVDSAWVLAGHEGALKLGVIEPDGPRWITTFSTDLQPFRLVVDGANVRFLALSSGKDVGDGLRLYVSADNGRTFAVSRLPGQAKEEAADLAPGGRAIFLDTRRRIHASPSLPR